MNGLVVQRLCIQPHDQVLDIGVGPGIGVQTAASAVVHGRVTGVDHSPLMVRLARRRNRRDIAVKRVDILLADWLDLPFPNASFDKVLSSNTIYFWSDPAAVLSEVRRVLKPDGLFALGFRPHQAWTARGGAKSFYTRDTNEQIFSVDEVRDIVTAAGLTIVGQDSYDDPPRDTCILLRNGSLTSR